MYNAAIIVLRRSTLPKILNFFVKPCICNNIEAGNDEIGVKVHIIESPVTKEVSNNRKIAHNLVKLCLENNISFFIVKNTGYYLGSGLEYLENSIERGMVDEIKAIKGLAALIKLSGDKQVDLLKKNMCFIGETQSYQYISTMLAEAAGVFIYEHDKMGNSQKKEIFERLMADKGISAAFTKDLGRAINQCDIILADKSVDLEAYQPGLSNKILIGDNAVTGNFEKISQALLWYDNIESMNIDNPCIYYNDEMLGVLRHFYKEKPPIDFIRKFPYIYLKICP